MMRRSFAFGLAIFCLSLLVGSLEVQAAPPPNDQCSGAEAINLVGPGPWLSSVITNMEEATSIGDPALPLECYDGPIASNSVWYTFTPTVSGLYTVSTKFTATVIDSLMGIYTSANQCSGPFVKYACNDDVGGAQSAVQTNFNAGTKYYVVIWPVTLQENEHNVQLKVSKVAVVPPPNDSCQNALVVPSSPQSLPYWTPTVDTYLANNTGDRPTPLCAGSQSTSNTWRSVWYKFRPSTNGFYIITTCTNNTATKIDHSVLSVYENTGGCGGTFTQLACDGGYCGFNGGTIISLTANVDYYIVVWDAEREPLPDETDLQVYVDRQGPPSVVTVGHTDLQQTSVTLVGSANPKGLSTRGYFQWGLTPAYGEETTRTSPRSDVFDFVFTRAVSQTIQGPLPPGATIYYRAAAVNSQGTTFGEGKSVKLAGPDIHTITRQGNGVRLQFTGLEGYNYEVQRSSDLRTWTRLGDAVPIEFDEYEFVDPGPLSGGQRFYRVRLLIN